MISRRRASAASASSSALNEDVDAKNPARAEPEQQQGQPLVAGQLCAAVYAFEESDGLRLRIGGEVPRLQRTHSGIGLASEAA
ncbi:MAG: hypothetical protein ACREVL_07165 [Solimonas sp.]